MTNSLRQMRHAVELSAVITTVLVTTVWDAVERRILPPPTVLDSWAD